MTINGSTRINIRNRYPRVFKNLNLFAGNHWHPSANGNIKNFVITSEDCFRRDDILRSTTSFWQSPIEFEFEVWSSAEVYYKVYNQHKTVSEANDACKNAHQTEFPIFLPGPINDDENNHLRFIMEQNQLTNIWLGIQRPTENTDGWFHEQNQKNGHKYFNWKLSDDGQTPLEPNNVDNEETNVAGGLIGESSKELVWNDVPPDWTLPFICLTMVRGEFVIPFQCNFTDYCIGNTVLLINEIKSFSDPALYILDSDLVDPQVILDYPGTIKLKQNQQIVRLIKNQPVTIEWPKYFKLKFSVKVNYFTDPADIIGFRNILHGL